MTSKQHYVVLRVALTCDEMDGSTEETAEVMLDLVEKLLSEHTATDSQVEVCEHGEVTA